IRQRLPSSTHRSWTQPAKRQASINDDGRLAFVEELAQLVPRGFKTSEAKLAAGLVVHAADALVFAEVNGENGARGRCLQGGVHDASSLWGGGMFECS